VADFRWPWQRADEPSEEKQEQRAEWGSSAIPLPGMGYFSLTGRPVGPDAATGLPAVTAAIRLVAESIASMPLIVYEGTGPTRGRAFSSQQYRLLHDAPNADQSPFDFVSDVVTSLEGFGNAYIQKVKRGNEVVELVPLDPELVYVYRDKDTRERRYDVIVDAQRVTGLTPADILHIRGMTLRGGLLGMSPIQVHRNALGNAIAVNDFVSRYFANDASPGLALKIPGQITSQQAKNILEIWQSSHGGVMNSHRPAVLASGAELDKVPITLEDALVIDAQQYNVREVARIFNVPPSLLGADGAATAASAAEEADRFIRFSLGPRLRRIELAFRADPDLFGSTDLFPEFLADALLRPDTATRYQAYLLGKQAGWLSTNEIRELENRPPVEGGDQVQITPVGGAPNAADEGGLT
jgi:HK97 family phage portal protein